MKSIKELYKIGIGPSSSHTMGPDLACKTIKNRHSNIDKVKVVLYGSLALTGKGHGTDEVIKRNFGNNTEIAFNYTDKNIKHPNTMDIFVYSNNNEYRYRIYSIGGGEIVFDGENFTESKDVYRFNSFQEIKNYCTTNGLKIYEYALIEEPDAKRYVLDVWERMKESIKVGLKTEGILPGGLNVHRKASILYNQTAQSESEITKENRIVCSYAFAVAEQNASQGEVVTAPTCGSSGVIPAVMYYYQNKYGYSDDEIVNALITAGVIGNLIKTNASISGAQSGCQAEIGSACSMASAGLAELLGMSLEQIEYSAEVAMEHHLGLTCDPVGGLVQIPCIERNAVAAMRAINAVSLAHFLTNTRKVSFDTIIKTMYETGRDMPSPYRETSEGGLAKNYKE